MKKAITAIAIFLVLSTTFAQQKTVEEIYAGYTQAIGGSEKLANIVNQKTVSITTTSNSLGTWSTTGIQFVDYNTQEMAHIRKEASSSLNGNKITFTRSHTANGKTTMLLPDGQKFEVPNVAKQLLNSDFLGTTVPPESKVLPNETFNGKEVYVINYEKEVAETKTDIYEYFDVVSHLKIGEKQISKTETSSSKSDGYSASFGSNSITASTTAINLEYKEMNGILYPYKRSVVSDSETTITTTSSLSVGTMVPLLSKLGKNVDEETLKKQIGDDTYTKTIKSHSEKVTEILAVEFNINPEDFKQNCFQQPEACFAAYEKN